MATPCSKKLYNAPTHETKLSPDSCMWQWLLRVPKKLYNAINLQDYSTCGKSTISSGSIGNTVDRRIPGMPLKCYRVQKDDSTPLRSNVMQLYSHHQAVKSSIYFVENVKLQP